jgi:hypothetical protein
VYRICPLALIPNVSTGTAIRFVDTDNLTAPKASPSLVLLFYELLDANFANTGKILDHAHSILCLIAGVQMAQGFTWEADATEAVINHAIR